MFLVNIARVGFESAGDQAKLGALGKQLAMHVAAANPQAVTIADVDPAALERERSVLAAQADGAQITTIEGLAKDGNLHPIQEGFWEKHGLQCGFCTPGMIMTACDLLQQNPNPSEEEIRHGLEGNLCRCTGYHNIVKAVQYAAAKMRGEEPVETEVAAQPA